MFRLLYIVLFTMLFMVFEVFPHPYERDVMFKQGLCFALDYQKSTFYKSQFGASVIAFRSKGFYRDLYARGLELNYAARFHKNDNVSNRFRFIMFDYNGWFFKPLLKYGESGDKKTKGEYLFTQTGIRVMEWSNINDFTEFTPLQLSTELVLENRNNKSERPGLYGLEYRAKLHSVYLIPRVNLSVSRIAIDDEIKKAYLQSIINSFWDVPIGGQLELGYDWTREINKTYDTPSGPRTSQRVVTNEFKILTDYKLYPLNDMKRLSYGFKADIDPYVEDIIGFYLDIHLSYNKNKIQIPGKSYSYDSFSIGLSN